MIFETFEEIAEQIQKEKAIENHNRAFNRKVTGEEQYVLFCAWCNAFNYGEGKNDPKVFKQYLKEENIELNFWQKKYLSEKYFNYEYKWDNDNGCWLSRKKAK